MTQSHHAGSGIALGQCKAEMLWRRFVSLQSLSLRASSCWPETLVSGITPLIIKSYIRSSILGFRVRL